MSPAVSAAVSWPQMDNVYHKVFFAGKQSLHRVRAVPASFIIIVKGTAILKTISERNIPQHSHMICAYISSLQYTLHLSNFFQNIVYTEVDFQKY